MSRAFFVNQSAIGDERRWGNKPAKLLAKKFRNFLRTNSLETRTQAIGILIFTSNFKTFISSASGKTARILVNILTFIFPKKCSADVLLYLFAIETLGSEINECQKSKFSYGASSIRRINLLKLQNIVVRTYLKYTFVRFRLLSYK